MSSTGGRVLAGEDSEDDDEGIYHLMSVIFTWLKLVHDAFASECSLNFPLQKTQYISNKSHQEGAIKAAESSDAGFEIAEAVDEKTNFNHDPLNRDDMKCPSQLLDDEQLSKLNIDGLSTMKVTTANKIKQSLNVTIRRISDLVENQEVLYILNLKMLICNGLECLQKLLKCLSINEDALYDGEKLKFLSNIMEQIPLYVQKIDKIQSIMSEVSVSSERLKKKTENLRIEAQSCMIILIVLFVLI